MVENRFERTLDKETEFAKNAEGVRLDEIAVGEKFRISTKNTEYILEHREDGFYLSGNKNYCPTPRKVQIAGSTRRGSAIMLGFIGIGMILEISSVQGYDIQGDRILTSPIQNIEKIKE
jgi:hypothetical protein